MNDTGMTEIRLDQDAEGLSKWLEQETIWYGLVPQEFQQGCPSMVVNGQACHEEARHSSSDARW